MIGQGNSIVRFLSQVTQHFNGRNPLGAEDIFQGGIVPPQAFQLYLGDSFCWQHENSYIITLFFHR